MILPVIGMNEGTGINPGQVVCPDIIHRLWFIVGQTMQNWSSRRSRSVVLETLTGQGKAQTVRTCCIQRRLVLADFADFCYALCFNGKLLFFHLSFTANLFLAYSTFRKNSILRW